MKKIRKLILLISILLISGCEGLPSFEDVVPDKRTTYKKSRDLPELEVPPDLTVTKGDYSAELPSDKESTSLNEFERQRAINKNNEILIASGNIEGEKWISLSSSANDIWPELREFWLSNGYTLYLDDSELGVLETNWKEIEKVRQKFKIISEAKEAGGTILFLSSERQELSEGDWLDTRSNESVEEDIISKLNLHFNNDLVKTDGNDLLDSAYSASSKNDNFNKTKAEIRNTEDGKNYLEVAENYTLAWSNTKKVIQQAGYFLENSDEEKGIYSFRYFRTKSEDEEKGFFSKLKFWGDEEEEKEEEGLLYQLSLVKTGNKTEIVVLKENAESEKSDDVMNILTTIQRLYNQL